MSNLAYKEEIKTELLNGKMVAMSPRPPVNHNAAIINITRIFSNYLKGKKCRVYSELDVYLTEKDIVVPDIIIVCNNNIIKNNGIHGAPDLIVEILSPGTTKKDRGYKKDLYESNGVKEYWIVDTQNFTIEVYLITEAKFVLENAYTIFPDYLIEKMTDEEKNNIEYEFKTSLYSDLLINLEDVFYNIV